MKKFTDKINESLNSDELNAEKFIDDNYYHLKIDLNKTDSYININDIYNVMIEFAKIHVEKALEEANRCIIESDDLQSDCESGRFNIKDIYPLDNIK